MDLTIPTSLHGVSSDAYASGAPTHAALGKRLADNDRALVANIKRSLCVPFPYDNGVAGVPAPPICCDRVGTDLMPWAFPTTMYTRQVQWLLTVQASAGPPAHEFWIVPYTVGAGSALPFRGWAAGSAYAVHVVGTGAEQLVTVPCPVHPGTWNEVGLVVFADFTGTVTNGTVRMRTIDTVVGQDNDFAAWNVDPPAAAIRLCDGIAGTPLSDWHQIRRVKDSGLDDGAGGVATLDLVEVFPPFSEQELQATVSAGATYAWQVRDCGQLTIQSITMREVPAAGTLATEAGPGGGEGAHPYAPIPREMSFSRGHFTAQYWWRLLENLQAIADRGGRVAWFDRYYDVQLGPAYAQIAEAYYTGGVAEESLAILPLWGVTGGQPGVPADALVEWYVTTSTLAGANLATSQTVSEQIVLPFRTGPRASLVQFCWPEHNYHARTEVRGQLLYHKHDAALPSSGRWMRFYAKVTGTSGFTPSVYLRGGIAIGFRGGL